MGAIAERVRLALQVLDLQAEVGCVTARADLELGNQGPGMNDEPSIDQVVGWELASVAQCSKRSVSMRI